MKFTIGVDEAGRGPIAGPVAVGVVCVPVGFDVAKEFPGVKDSKQMTEKKREEIFEMLSARAVQGDVHFTVEFEDSDFIDEKGIVAAVRESAWRGIHALAPLGQVHVLLEGLLSAPPEYTHETIIRGEHTVPIISLASVAAKVMRDRLMKDYDLQFPNYGFGKHKGYGTTAHYAALEKLGPSVIHRKTYL